MKIASGHQPNEAGPSTPNRPPPIRTPGAPRRRHRGRLVCPGLLGDLATLDRSTLPAMRLFQNDLVPTTVGLPLGAGPLIHAAHPGFVAGFNVMDDPFVDHPAASENATTPTRNSRSITVGHAEASAQAQDAEPVADKAHTAEPIAEEVRIAEPSEENLKKVEDEAESLVMAMAGVIVVAAISTPAPSPPSAACSNTLDQE